MASVFDNEVYLNYSFLVAAIKSNLNASQMSVYLALVGWAVPETGIANVSQRTLTMMIGLDPDTHRTQAQRNLMTLERLGLIKLCGKDKKTKTTSYEICHYQTLIKITVPELKDMRLYKLYKNEEDKEA